MRYGIVTLIVVVLIIVGAVAIFGGGGGSDEAANGRVTRLADYSANSLAEVSWTQQGRLVGEDERRSVRVTVGKNSRRVELLAGYEERVEKSQSFVNTEAAFDAFTRALDGLGFGRERTVAQPDERGVCPQGNRYVYRLTDGSQEVMRTWSTTCRTSEGNFGGGNANTTQIAQLFRTQIADFHKFVSGVRF